jgi:hypothetical protein
VFIAAALCLVVALACLAGIEERPLRGPAEHAGEAAQRALLDAAE